jgi:DNA repair protein RadC
MKKSKTDRKTKGIKGWPASERPRELLLGKGPEAVSDAGLVAILLRTGIKGKDAVTLSRELLQHFGGLKGLLNADSEALKKVKGLGTAKVAQLLAATEMTKRQFKEQVIGKSSIHGPEDVIEYLSLSMADLKDEVFKVIYLNTAHVVIAIEELFRGTPDQSAVYPRKIIKRALELNASGLIFVHNHPSGDLKPSDNDLSLNRKLVQACLAVDLMPLDHLIIGPTGYLSLKEKGVSFNE